MVQKGTFDPPVGLKSSHEIWPVLIREKYELSKKKIGKKKIFSNFVRVLRRKQGRDESLGLVWAFSW